MNTSIKGKDNLLTMVQSSSFKLNWKIGKTSVYDLIIAILLETENEWWNYLT